MRSLRLLEVAAQAESLRLRCQAAGAARSAAFIVAASVFGLFALALLHLAAVIWLAPRHGALAAVLYVVGADVVLGLLLVLAARRNKYKRVAEQAKELRRDSLRMLRHVSPVNEVMILIPWRGLAIGIAGRLFARLLRGRRRR